MILSIIRGFFMALADSVPGVSGGTIAFIMGFYDDFINSLNCLSSVRSSKDEKKKAIIFLLKIGVGWIIGMTASVLFLASIFEKNIYDISSFFIGLIIFSIPLIYKEEKKEIVGKYFNLIWLLIGVLLVVLITRFNSLSIIEVSFAKANLFTYIYVFICGSIAICAMILPGISGSTLLLIFGIYASVIGAIKELLHLNFSYFFILFVFGLGILFGIFSSIRLIKKLLIFQRSKMIYFIMGLMIGSIYAVIYGPTTLEVSQAPLAWHNFSWMFMALGGIVIIGLEKLKDILK